MQRSPRTWCAIVVAAGRGTRFGRPKQLVEIAGEPMVTWSVRTFAQIDEIAGIVVVTEREWLADVVRAVAPCCTRTPVDVVPGGASRQSSTYAGLCAVPGQCDAVLVHDGARPLVSANDVRSGMEPVRAGHASILAVPIVDTIKRVDPQSHTVAQTLERGLLWAAQTPQFAMLADLRAAHEQALREGFEATDDSMLLERAGTTVHVVPGSVENFKVTMPEDGLRADRAMRVRLAGQLR